MNRKNGIAVRLSIEMNRKRTAREDSRIGTPLDYDRQRSVWVPVICVSKICRLFMAKFLCSLQKTEKGLFLAKIFGKLCQSGFINWYIKNLVESDSIQVYLLYIEEVGLFLSLQVKQPFHSLYM